MTQPKRIAIIGSTGSIGTQTLDTIAAYPDMFKATVLTAHRNAPLLIEQSLRFRPNLAVIGDDALYGTVRDALSPHGIEVASGSDALTHAAAREDADTVVTATVGYSGLAPTIAAISSGKEIALANKETLVVAGEMITEMLSNSASKIIPVDSEHSAIYQCLAGEDKESVSKLIITASGGPFRKYSKKDLETVSARDALRHPNWNMGAKITIDSASMMNKAFEIIEARWLFGIEPERIKAVVTSPIHCPFNGAVPRRSRQSPARPPRHASPDSLCACGSAKITLRRAVPEYYRLCVPDFRSARL